MSWKPRIYPPAIDRLLSRCAEDANGCWAYQGVTDRKGYVRVGHEGGKAFGHRITWEFFVGPWPDGLTFDHLCRNTSCLNPWHGEPVPMSVNSQRNNNAMKQACPQGHPYDSRTTRGRTCRTCRNESNRAYRARMAGAA